MRKKVKRSSKTHKEAQIRWEARHPGVAAQRSHLWRKENRDYATQENRKWSLAHPGYHKKASFRSKQKRKKSRPWIMLLEGAKQRAFARKFSYNLTEAWAIKRWTGKCELTGISFISVPSVKKKKQKGTSLYSASLDRISSKKGYTKRNCRFILTAINWFKNRGSDKDILQIAKALVEYQCVKKERQL